LAPWGRAREIPCAVSGGTTKELANFDHETVHRKPRADIGKQRLTRLAHRTKLPATVPRSPRTMMRSNPALRALALAFLISISRAGGAAAPARAADKPPEKGGPPNVPAARVINLWPEGVPLAKPDAPPERVEDGRIYNVSVPTLTVFPAPAGTANGLGMIVCPGGGYVRLAVDNEGSAATRWLNGIGVTVFVLKYRVAPNGHPAPLLDVLRAVRLVRSRASELGVDPHRIGVLGTSAGGHVAASAGTLFDAPEGRTGAALDKVSARPDFLVLLYPVITMKDPYVHAGSRRALLGDGPSADLVARTSMELHVTRETPPTFLAHTQEDRSVPVENSLLFYSALRTAGVPVEMHLYEKGPHGFGLQPGLGTTSEWPLRCEEWMRAHGWMTRTR
jgi:acetyl esterase/lipase